MAGGGTDGRFFSISNGALSLKVPQSFEGKNTYALTVTARDTAANDASIALTVTLLDVDEPPEIISGAGTDLSENEGQRRGSPFSTSMSRKTRK